jgi:hypothetical protein
MSSKSKLATETGGDHVHWEDKYVWDRDSTGGTSHETIERRLVTGDSRLVIGGEAGTKEWKGNQ